MATNLLFRRRRFRRRSASAIDENGENGRLFALSGNFVGTGLALSAVSREGNVSSLNGPLSLTQHSVLRTFFYGSYGGSTPGFPPLLWSQTEPPQNLREKIETRNIIVAEYRIVLAQPCQIVHNHNLTIRKNAHDGSRSSRKS